MPTSLIAADPRVMMGKPVVAGTRITVELIPEELAAGATPQDLINGYPALSRESIAAALHFAAESLRADTVYPTLST